MQGGWPFRADRALCKFGITTKRPERRLKENQATLRRWGIDADLRLCFVAVGQIASEAVEEKVRDHTLFWRPNRPERRFERNSEWRRCQPRELARLAVLIAEEHARSGRLKDPERPKEPKWPKKPERPKKSEWPKKSERPAQRDGRPVALDRENAKPGYLRVPGTEIRRVPLPSGSGDGTGREAAESPGKASIRKGRPLREPIPWATPQDSRAASRETSPEENASEENAPEDRPEGHGEGPGPQPERNGAGDAGRAGCIPGTGLSGGPIPTKTRQSHRGLRQRNFFAERRALRRASQAGSGTSGCRDISPGPDASPNWQASPKQAPNRDALLNVQMSPVRSELLEEAISRSLYQSRSAFIRAAGTGRDRSASIVAKSGIFSYWIYGYLGQEIGERGPEDKPSGDKASGENAWEELRGLARPLFRTADLGQVLRLVRKHLFARLLLAEDGGAVPKEALPAHSPAGPATGRRGKGTRSDVDKNQVGDNPIGEDGVLSDLKGLAGRTENKSRPISACLCEEKKALIRENAAYSDYDNMSSYLRHLILGWDRNREAVAQSATVAHWLGARLGENIQPGHWEELGRLMRRRFDLFLFGTRGEKDPRGRFQQRAEHLLGTRFETVAGEMGLPRYGGSSR